MAELDNRGHWLASAMMLTWSWSTLMYIVRVWAKLQVRRWGAEDYTVTAAFLVSTMQIAATYWAIQTGYGLPLDQIAALDRDIVLRSLYAGQELYILAVGLTKISTALFIVHLSCSGPQVRPGYFIAAASAIWTVASMLTIGLRGDIVRPWATIDGSSILYLRWIVVETTGLIVEVLLVALAISLIYGLNIPLTKRLLVISAFAVRLLLIPLAALRLHFLSPTLNSGPTFTSIAPNIVTEMTLHFAVISASIASLRPFLRTFHASYSPYSRTTSKRSDQSTGLHKSRGSHRLSNLENAIPRVHVQTDIRWTDKTLQPTLRCPLPAFIHAKNRPGLSTTIVANATNRVSTRQSTELILPIQAQALEKTAFHKAHDCNV